MPASPVETGPLRIRSARDRLDSDSRTSQSRENKDGFRTNTPPKGDLGGCLSASEQARPVVARLHPAMSNPHAVRCIVLHEEGRVSCIFPPCHPGPAWDLRGHGRFGFRSLGLKTTRLGNSRQPFPSSRYKVFHLRAFSSGHLTNCGLATSDITGIPHRHRSHSGRILPSRLPHGIPHTPSNTVDRDLVAQTSPCGRGDPPNE